MIIVIQTLVFFRESLFAVFDRVFRPYIKHFALTFNRNNNVSDDEESEDHVFAEYDDEKGVIFCPPMYAQRYAAVSDCLMDERWCGKLEKVVDLGYHDMSFIKYLRDVPGVKQILGVDIESFPLRCSSDLFGSDEYAPKRETPLHISLFQGNAADPDYRLIGSDAVIAIEMIEHMYPHDLERLVHTIFGFIKPWIAVITTPNGDFNPLFKSLEKNGFRRLDHFFEWSREQFHDWGVGPGPPDTLRYGCCSQLALFVSKDYHKQRDLNLNSLALVAKAPSTNNEIQALDFPDSDCNMLCSPKNLESYTELVFSNTQSCVTIVLSPAFSFESIEYRDKTSQCNIDTEIGKNFLMFNEEESCAVVVPRRRRADNRVYIIEDVNCRLNCTTLQVKKFSKKTQHLMAKNKMHSLEHTKEVVDEIRHLTRMLNFNNDSRVQAEGDHTWHNINWGENAPYWNQYYQLVKEYTYPFEPKSEECRILDLISDEINRVVDMQCDEDMDVNKVEIPIHHLMRVVQHITDDVDRVKDLLEWNGYEIAGDVVIYSRLTIDTVSVNSHENEWPDNETFSDWDTDVRSTSLSASDGSTGHEGHGRSLYRALDQKVRTLRSMISNNEDISAELDKVVCRLTKLALRTARRRQQPLSNRWMQCKLLDLLNLTEKAIGKKRQLYTEMNPLKAICYDNIQMEMVDLSKINRNETASKLVDKYRHIVQMPEKANASEESRELSYDVMEDDLANVFLDQTSSTELNFEEMIRFPSLIDIEPISPVHSPKHYSKVIPLSCLKAWADGNDKVLVYSVQNSSHCISSGDTDHSACNITAFRNQKNNKKRRGSAGRKPDLDLRHRIKTPSKTSYGKRRGNRKSNGHHDNNESVEQNVKKKPSYNILDKNSHQRLSAADVKKYLYKGKKSYKHMLQSRSRPISPTLIQFCHPNTENERDSALKESSTDLIELAPNNIDDTIAITKESLLIDIITEDNEETIALRRTIGTDAEDDLLIFENEQEHTRGSMTNVMNIDSFNDKPINGSEEIHSQTLFLYDINEPSTSKGIRHVSMDVQCGPESDNNYAMLSSTTSFTKRPQIFNAGLKIVNSFSDEQEHVINCDFGTSTNENFDSCKEISAKRKFTGIKIKDSETKITNKVETVTQETNTNLNISSILNLVSTTETRILESVSSHYKIEDSGSELCDSLSSSQRSPLHFMNFAKDTSGFPIKLTEDVELESKFSHKLIRPKLSNGGVYVHSYKERQMSEDVVYQGDWQRYTTVAAPKKKSCNVVTNRTLELNKRIRNDNKDNACTNKNIRPATVNLVRNNNVKNVKQVKKMPTVNNMAKVTSCNKNATKVASKLTSKRLLSKKSSTIIKKPPKTPTMLKTESEVMPKPRRKSYIPLYLKRKLSTNNHQNEHLDCGEQNKNEKVIVNKKVERSVNEIKTVLLKFNPEPNESVNYVVFKNEIETNNHCSTDSENIFNSDNDDERTNDSNKRSPSPQSFNSSAGSSPNSIATVRVRPTLRLADKRHSNSSNRSNQGLFQTENTEIINKKLTKKCKSVKKYQNNISDNKENLPESSKRNKDIAFSSTFSKNKSIFRAQIASENPQSANNIVNRRKSTNKANIKIPSVPSFTGKHSISGTSTMPSLSPENKSLKDSFNTKKAVNSMIQDSEIEQNSVIINIVDNNLLTEWMTTTQTLIAESQSSNIASAMRQLVEERLEFIERLSDNDAEADSRTVQMSERCNSVPASDTTSFHDATSLNSSYGTVMGFNDYTQIVDWNEMDLDNIFFDSVVYNEYDPAVDNDSIIGITGTKPNVTDLELLSFNSIASASKVSEYFLAEGSSNNDSDIQNSVTPADNCVRDIFERKAPLSIESPAGRLTIQAFSGLSMNAAPAARVLQDHVNLVDSETGSIARDHVRQTTSEEVFVSGRSSGSFDSCVINEDAVVPDWLFRIISQQQALEEDEDENDDEDEDEEEESEHLIPIQLPLAEPIYDVNGNAVEPGMGAGAGAGDGRGIHSDHSQDSSGRGTSLSSSVTSSGPQSEAILIDPTAFTMPYDLIREPASSSSIIVSQLPTHFEAADTSRATAEGPMNSRNAAILNSSGDPQILPVRAASDIDADISSIDTDVPDSSDN